MQTRAGGGKFSLRGSGVTGFRLLLTQEELGPRNSVLLTWQGKALAPRPATVDKAIALGDFAERFDRTRIPVVEFRGP